MPVALSDASTAQYIVDLAGSGESCRAAVIWLRDWSATLNAKK